MTPGAVFDAFDAYRKEREREDRRLAWQTAALMSAILKKRIRPERLLNRPPSAELMEMVKEKQRSTRKTKKEASAEPKGKDASRDAIFAEMAADLKPDEEPAPDQETRLRTLAARLRASR